MPVQGIFQLVYHYVSNRIDSLSTTYFFPYIYYTEHSYTHLKLIFVRNSWQYISKNGKIFLKMERSFLWLISTPLIHPLRHRPFKASFMHIALFETPSPCFYAFKIV